MKKTPILTGTVTGRQERHREDEYVDSIGYIDTHMLFPPDVYYIGG